GGAETRMSGAQRARLAVAGSDRKLGLLQREIGDRAESEKLDLGHLDQHLGYFVRRLQVMIFRDFIRTLAPMTLRPAQYSVLLLIEANPGSSQAAIGRALG